MHRIFHLLLDRLPQLHFDLRLKLTLPSRAAKEDFPCLRKREFLLEKSQALGRTFAARLFDSAKKTAHLSQRLIFACLKKQLATRQPRFVMRDDIKRCPELARDLVELYLSTLAC